MAFRKKIFILAVIAILFPIAVVSAVNITVPAAPGFGYWLISTSTGAYNYTTSTNSTVNLTGSSTANSFPYWLDANGNLSPTSTLFISSSTGYIGIGTASPANKLDVNGSADVEGNLAVGTTTTSTATLNVVGTAAVSGTSTFFWASHHQFQRPCGCEWK